MQIEVLRLRLRNDRDCTFFRWNAPGGVAGGGIKPGITYGRSDDDGYEAVENPMQIAYLHTTILADLGLDHVQLTFRRAGPDFRLTDVKGTLLVKS